MTAARSLRVLRHGDASGLAVDEVDVPQPGPGQVRVAVRAAGINFIDVYKREGSYPVPTPFTLGEEGAGVLESAGEGVDLAPGERVAWAMHTGAFGELALVPAGLLVSLPDEVAFDTGAAAMLQGMTAHALVNSVYAVQPGDAVLVHAAAGGVGQWLVQLCAAKGATVVATAGTADKLEKARTLGAHALVNYAEADDLAAAIRDANGGAGVHVAYDGVGKATFDASMAALRRRGMLVLFGASSGPVPPLDPQRLNAAGSVYLTRPTLAHYIAERDELRWRAGEVLGMLGSGAVSMQIGGRYPLEEAAAAYRALQGRETTGKLIFTL
ncbi:MAG: quinone oxidoreductase family protein [Dermatophilaceae bacterium]